MKNKLDKIKVIFADVDNTLLCLKMYDNEGKNDKEKGKRTVGFAEYESWLKYNINNNAYIHCQAPEPIKKLVKYLHDRGAMVYGLTECSNSFEYNAQYNRLRECYEGSFLHHGDLISIDTRHKKVLIMQMIAERDGYNPDEIMFIDDSYTEVMEAFNAGLLSMHTTEAMMRFGDINSII